MEGRRHIRQRLGAAEKERENARDKAESLVRNIDEAKGVVRESRDRECNAWPKSLIWIGD